MEKNQRKILIFGIGNLWDETFIGIIGIQRTYQCNMYLTLPMTIMKINEYKD
jgi:hypothetical protein